MCAIGAPSDCASDCDPLGFVHVRHRSSPLIASSESLIAPLITPMSAGAAGQPVACRRGTSHTHRRLPRCRRARWRCARHGAQRVDQGRVHPLTTARSRRAAAEERRESADWDPIWQPRSASADWDPIWAARRCLASLYETHLRHPRFVTVRYSSRSRSPRWHMTSDCAPHQDRYSSRSRSPRWHMTPTRCGCNYTRRSAASASP